MYMYMYRYMYMYMYSVHVYTLIGNGVEKQKSMCFILTPSIETSI